MNPKENADKPIQPVKGGSPLGGLPLGQKLNQAKMSDLASEILRSSLLSSLPLEEKFEASLAHLDDSAKTPVDLKKAVTPLGLSNTAHVKQSPVEEKEQLPQQPRDTSNLSPHARGGESRSLPPALAKERPTDQTNPQSLLVTNLDQSSQKILGLFASSGGAAPIEDAIAKASSPSTDANKSAIIKDNALLNPVQGAFGNPLSNAPDLSKGSAMNPLPQKNPTIAPPLWSPGRNEGQGSAGGSPSGFQVATFGGFVLLSLGILTLLVSGGRLGEILAVIGGFAFVGSGLLSWFRSSS